jgi:hypothetical protein
MKCTPGLGSGQKSDRIGLVLSATIRAIRGKVFFVPQIPIQTPIRSARQFDSCPFVVKPHPENGFYTELAEVGRRAEFKFRVPSSAFRVADFEGSIRANPGDPWSKISGV